jgi:hypothetical protein
MVWFYKLTVGFASLSSGFTFRGGNPVSIMALVGQTGAHLRQNLHLSESINARLLPMVMASYSQTLKHLLQPMQATAQAFYSPDPYPHCGRLHKFSGASEVFFSVRKGLSDTLSHMPHRRCICLRQLPEGR